VYAQPSARQPSRRDSWLWDLTFEALLRLSAGRRSIEIKLVSRAPERMPSLVLSDWEVEVR